MNFLQLLASGASILNFNFQSKSAQALDSISKTVQKSEGFKKVEPQPDLDTFNPLPPQIPTEQATILNQILYNERQQLINRYLQLNLRLLEGNIPQKEAQVQSSGQEENQEQILEKEELQHQEKAGNSKKKIKKLVKCGHDDKAHYAKGMCNNCYHKYGRTKKPWNCPHEKLYAGGMCQNCYINMYNRKKREEQHPAEEKVEQESVSKDNLVILGQQKPEERRETRTETGSKAE